MRQRDPGRIDALTGVRFFAALIVLLFHYQERDFVHFPGPLRPFVAQGPAGVTLFFVLSGFILYYTYHRQFEHGVPPTHLWGFVRARIARVYPLHVLALLILTPLTLWYLRTQTSGAQAWLAEPVTPRLVAGSWLSNLLLIQVYFPRMAFEELWNGPAWSIANEFVFYAFFPLFVAFVLGRVRGAKGLPRLAVGLWAIEACVLLVTLIFGANVARLDFVTYRLPVLRIWEFFLGCTMGAFYVRSRNPKDGTLGRAQVRNLAVGVALVGCFAVALLPAAFDVLRWYVLYPPLFALLILALASGPTFISPLLEQRWILLLGEASYALYIIQAIPRDLLTHLLSAGLAVGAGTPWPAVAMLSTVLGSVLFFRYFETPMRRALRGRRPPAAVLPLAPAQDATADLFAQGSGDRTGTVYGPIGRAHR